MRPTAASSVPTQLLVSSREAYGRARIVELRCTSSVAAQRLDRAVPARCQEKVQRASSLQNSTGRGTSTPKAKKPREALSPGFYWRGGRDSKAEETHDSLQIPYSPETESHATFSESAAKCGKVGVRAIDCVRFETKPESTGEAPELDEARAAYAAAFDAFARLALSYFDSPTDELRAACEAAALVVRTAQKAG